MSNRLTSVPPNLILGCGYLGLRVASLWRVLGIPVAALTRANATRLSERGIDPIVGDILDRKSLSALPEAKTVLYAVGWDRTVSKTMSEVFISGLGNVIDTLPGCARFIYVSSTGVYGQTDGEFVAESSPTEPFETSGKVVLEAERLLRQKMPAATILRFAGMYGPDRLLRKQALIAGEPFNGDAERWLNLIHIEDGADAVLAAEAHGKPGETYNIADDVPVTRRAFYTLLAEMLGSPPARFNLQPEPHQSHRRISNRKAKENLLWQPRYPSYREGLAALLNGAKT